MAGHSSMCQIHTHFVCLFCYNILWYSVLYYSIYNEYRIKYEFLSVASCHARPQTRTHRSAQLSATHVDGNMRKKADQPNGNYFIKRMFVVCTKTKCDECVIIIIIRYTKHILLQTRTECVVYVMMRGALA